MILSFDIGGTKIAVGLVKKNQIFNFQKLNWQGKITQQKFLNQLIEIILNFKSSISNLKAITIAVAGQVNKKGEVFLTRNLIRKKTKISLKKILQQKFHLPVFVENDANCFTLGEAVFGQGKNKDFLLGLTIGSGIGGGIVIDKKIIKGKDGFAGEFGHLILEVGGRKCSCGKRGCFEAYASARAMEEFYFELTGRKKTTFQIKEEFLKKKSDAILAVNETARWLSIGIANLVNIFNPDLIVLGGGMINFPSFLKIAIKNFKSWLLVKEAKTKILVSNLNEKATLLGASLLTYEKR